MTSLFRSRKHEGATLAAELRKLELRAREQRTADGQAYNRALLADESGVSEKTLTAWFNGDRTPRDDDQLMRIVSLLNLWAGASVLTDQRDWAELRRAARKRARSDDAATSSDRHWLRRPVVWVGGIIASAAATVIAGWLTSTGQHLLTSTNKIARPPFEWTVSRSANELNFCAEWVFQKPISEIPVRNFGGGIAKAAANESWAVHGGGTDVDSAAYTITLQGVTPDNVAIQDVRVKVLSRIPARHGTFVASKPGCGGVITVRHFEVKLKGLDPQIVPAAGTASWPYTISGKDIEELCLNASASGKYEYSFVYQIDWAQGGKTGTVEVRAPGGRPFTLTPLDHSRAYFVNNGKWARFAYG